jgi:hypothetical protein
MPSDDPRRDDSDDASQSSIEERYSLDEDEAAPKANPDADKGPDAHIGGGQSLDAPDEDDEWDEAREKARALDQVGKATGELPEDVEPINATGFESTDEEVSTLKSVDQENVDELDSE